MNSWFCVVSPDATDDGWLLEQGCFAAWEFRVLNFLASLRKTNERLFCRELDRSLFAEGRRGSEGAHGRQTLESGLVREAIAE
jgi:hypothetical protein